MFLDRRHPHFGNFNSAVPVDVIRVKSYVDSFLDPAGVPVRVSINKLYLVPKRIIAGLVGVLRKVSLLKEYCHWNFVIFGLLNLSKQNAFINIDFE